MKKHKQEEETNTMKSPSRLVTGTAPHWHEGVGFEEAMRDVLIALIPVIITSLYVFRGGALLVMIVCVAGAVAGEIVARRYKGEEPNLKDGTALVTGLLLAFTLPPVPWWAAVPLYTGGGFLATAIFREAMGGIGRNRFNPALLSRLFMLIGRTSLVYMYPFVVELFPGLDPWLVQLEVHDVMAKPTPLLTGAEEAFARFEYGSLLTIYEGGSLAETSVLAILAGIIFLLIRKRIDWRIPASIIVTVFLLTALIGEDPVYYILSGGLIFGAGFMATDWVTSPVTGKGKFIFGVAIGVLVVFFRHFVSELWVGYGGVAFSILIMNAFVPYLDRKTSRKIYGEK